jgi:hypothetical protein
MRWVFVLARSEMKSAEQFFHPSFSIEAQTEITADKIREQLDGQKDKDEECND